MAQSTTLEKKVTVLCPLSAVAVVLFAVHWLWDVEVHWKLDVFRQLVMPLLVQLLLRFAPDPVVVVLQFEIVLQVGLVLQFEIVLQVGELGELRLHKAHTEHRVKIVQGRFALGLLEPVLPLLYAAIFARVVLGLLLEASRYRKSIVAVCQFQLECAIR